MKLFYQGKHVKTVPKKFKDLGEMNLGYKFKDAEYKRLTDAERLELEVDLYKNNLGKHEMELIGNKRMSRVEMVHTNWGDSFPVGIFGRYKLRIPTRIYSLCDEKKVSYKTL